MRKILVLVILLFAVMFSVGGCANKTSVKLERNTVRHDELTDKVLPSIKEDIRDSLGNKEYLNWERFNEISEIRWFKSPELVGEFSDSYAFYDRNLNTVIVCPTFFELDGERGAYAIIHELMHSLTCVKEAKKDEENLLAEGVADFTAAKVLADIDINCNITYENEVNCIRWLTSLYGIDFVVEKICKGEMADFIDEQAGDGSGARLYECLETLDRGNIQSRKEAVLEEIDILQKVSGSNIEVSKEFTEKFESTYAVYLLF